MRYSMILGNHKSPFQIRLIKTLRHLNPDEIILLLFFDPSESSLQGIKALKNSIGISSGPQAFKVRSGGDCFAKFPHR